MGQDAGFCPECKIHVYGNFCRTCGTKLVAPPPNPRCKGCGAELSENDRFCRECGIRVVTEEIEGGTQ